MTEKAYRYRFDPTCEQENLLRRTLGCVRLVYNKAPATRTESWYERQERIGYSQTNSRKLPTQIVRFGNPRRKPTGRMSRWKIGVRFYVGKIFEDWSESIRLPKGLTHSAVR